MWLNREKIIKPRDKIVKNLNRRNQMNRPKLLINKQSLTEEIIYSHKSEIGYSAELDNLLIFIIN